jgi:hypothetical protein
LKDFNVLAELNSAQKPEISLRQAVFSGIPRGERETGGKAHSRTGSTFPPFSSFRELPERGELRREARYG